MDSADGLPLFRVQFLHVTVVLCAALLVNALGFGADTPETVAAGAGRTNAVEVQFMATPDSLAERHRQRTERGQAFALLCVNFWPQIVVRIRKDRHRHLLLNHNRGRHDWRCHDWRCHDCSAHQHFPLSVIGLDFKQI